MAKASFSTMAKGLAELATWLRDAGVTTVGMEATGIYWKPVFYELEGLFDEVWLCNAQHVKNVPGRRTDLSDAEWLADVVAHGMVRPSFVAPAEIREVRELSRYRKTQVDARVTEIQRLEKTLQDAGIKLTSVASSVWLKSTRAMIEAMIDGERDPEVLADMWPWPTPSWPSPGTCSPTALSTTTREVTTSTAGTIRHARRSGSSVGSRPSGSRSLSPRRPRRTSPSHNSSVTAGRLVVRALIPLGR